MRTNITPPRYQQLFVVFALTIFFLAKIFRQATSLEYLFRVFALALWFLQVMLALASFLSCLTLLPRHPSRFPIPRLILRRKLLVDLSISGCIAYLLTQRSAETTRDCDCLECKTYDIATKHN